MKNGFKIIRKNFRGEFGSEPPRPRFPIQSVTFEVDITTAEGFARDHRFPTYMNLCYYFARALNETQHFRLRVVNGDLVMYERLDLHVSLPTSDCTYGQGLVVMHDDPFVFHTRAASLFGPLELEPDQVNMVHFSTMHNTHFTGWTEQYRDFGSACVMFGKLSRGERILVPVALEISQPWVDRAAISTFVGRVNSLLEDRHH